VTLLTRTAIGAACGLAWACGLRGAMAGLAGAESTVTWSGTFGWILLPAVLVGALLGWAEHLRQVGGRPGWRWLAVAPMLLAAVLFANPGGLAQFLRDGIGGGALAYPIFGMLGGYAFSRRGPLWPRLLGRFLLLAPIPAGAVALILADPPVSAHDAWVLLSFYAFLLVLTIACVIPHLPVVAWEGDPLPRSGEPAIRTGS
jgi:hypothetical protein